MKKLVLHLQVHLVGYNEQFGRLVLRTSYLVRMFLRKPSKT